MNKIQQSAEVLEKMMWKEMYNMRLTEREKAAIDNILMYLSLTGEYTLPEHLKAIN
jgi:hypothetical protein